MDSILPLIKAEQSTHLIPPPKELSGGFANPEARAPYRADHDDAMIQTEKLCQKRGKRLS
jgi:hypothetical protein